MVILKNTPSSKKIHAQNRKIDAAVGTRTTYLSDEFIEYINKITGQKRAREVFDAGTQEDAVRKLHLTRGDGAADQVSSFEG